MPPGLVGLDSDQVQWSYEANGTLSTASASYADGVVHTAHTWIQQWCYTGGPVSAGQGDSDQTVTVSIPVESDGSAFTDSAVPAVVHGATDNDRQLPERNDRFVAERGRERGIDRVGVAPDRCALGGAPNPSDPYTLAGVGTASAAVAVRDATGAVVATATADEQGAFSVTVPTGAVPPLLITQSVDGVDSEAVVYNTAPLPLASRGLRRGSRWRAGSLRCWRWARAAPYGADRMPSRPASFALEGLGTPRGHTHAALAGRRSIDGNEKDPEEETCIR